MKRDSTLAPAPDAAAPPWPSASEVALVTAQLRTRRPLVSYPDCAELRERFAQAASGRAVVIQAGDCAEMFDEVSRRNTNRKRAQLDGLADIVTRTTGLPAVQVGRIAGQFAKPRSQPVERAPDGADIPVYRGDAVNGSRATPTGRVPDARRMLAAYDRSADVLHHLGRRPSLWTSHEALLCDYEEALVRRDPRTGALYGSSAHLLWVGDRTREAAGPQVRVLAGVANPVAVKLGPSATPGDVAELVDVLDPDRTPGRLVFVPRLGVDRLTARLPDLVQAARACGARPLWLCDPMHANTVRTATGRKTRVIEDVLDEVGQFVNVLRAVGEHPGGLHLEVTPDDVTECVTRETQTDPTAFPRYWTACDPRLNPEQARFMVTAFARAAAR